jgi:DNA polymerase III subunit delta
MTMASDKPVVYIFHGEDEFSIAREVSKLKDKLDGSSVADMSTTQFDGRSLDFAELRMTCLAAPFMARRRLVILTHPLASLSTPAAREAFISFLEEIPASTALVLIEHRRLTSNKDLDKGKIHWLENWARTAGERVYLRQFDAKKDATMQAWIQQRAAELGGEFSLEAARLLSNLVADDTLMADQEIQKLLLYVNFSRPVEEGDVVLLTPFEGKLEDFALVNALREKDAQLALQVVRKQLEEDDPLRILGSIVYQFRLLLLARALLDEGGTVSDAAAQLISKLQRVNPGPAYHAARYALKFTTPTLENIYRLLLETDTAIKTGEMSAELALETLVTQLSA